jgi:MFS family permease
MPGSDVISAQAQAGPREPVRWSFTAGLAAAHIGAAFAFAPLLSILIPLRAEALDPAHKQVVLSTILFWGAITAGAANILGGAFSDATRSKWGRRRPWIFLGLGGSLASYLVIASSHEVTGLLVGVLLFQFCFNLLFAPLGAIFPDRVPDRQKGMVSGFLSLGYPVGSGLGAVLIGQALQSDTMRYLAIALVLVATVGPFALRLSEPPPERPSAHVEAARPPAGLYRDFLFAWAARFLVQVACAVAYGYGVFYLEDVTGYGTLFKGRRPEQGFAVLVFVSMLTNIVFSVLAGRLSDLTGRRKLFIVLAGATMALALAVAATGPSWPVLIGAWALLGAGMGAFTAVESALIAQVLPSPHTTGRDLGVMNLGNTLPQCVGPVLALVLLRGAHPDYRTLFAVAGAIALVGAAVVLGVRRVR